MLHVDSTEFGSDLRVQSCSSRRNVYDCTEHADPRVFLLTELQKSNLVHKTHFGDFDGPRLDCLSARKAEQQTCGQFRVTCFTNFCLSFHSVA